MKVISVDDDPQAVERTLGVLGELPGVDEAKGFEDPGEALDWLDGHPVDVAVLDINMPGLDGISLAAEIRKKQPAAAILFLTSYKKYAYDAYSVHPDGYLLKPVTREKLAAEIRYISGTAPEEGPGRIRIRTFGNFDVFVDDRPVSFKLAKAKEILAYLVDRQGAGVTRADIFAAIWEDVPYDRRMQKQLDVYIRSLRATLKEYGISRIMEMEEGSLRVIPETFTCDAYLFYSGASDTINAYRGEYMSAYSWASMTESILAWRTNMH